MASIKGGQKLEAALNRIASELKRKAVLRVGFLEGATYPDGTPVALVAAVQNWGAPSRGIPPRPFFTNAVEKHKDEWPRALRLILKATDYNLQRSLGQMGELIKGQIQASIRDTNAPPLAPATVKAKGLTKPLIATSHMLNSVSYEVRDLT